MNEITISAALSKDFTAAMNHFASGVAVVTSHDGHSPVGATVAAIAPIASDPPTVMVSMSTGSTTAAAIIEARTFTVNVLDEDSAALAGHFASRTPDKFANVAMETDRLGNPLLPNRVAALGCRVIDVVAAGSHWEIRGVAIEVEATGGNPLAYYRGAFAHLHTDADRSVLDAVRGHVLSMRTDRDHPLDPDRLADDLSVSRGSVLRALSRVKSEGLVERNNGAYVVAGVADEIVDAAYTAKLVLEIGVASQVIGRVHDAELRMLRTRLEDVRAAAHADGDDVDGLVGALDALGECFIGLGDSEPLVRAYRSLGLPGIDRRTITRAMLADIPPAGGFEDVVTGLERRDLSMVLDALRAEQRTPAYVREITRRKGEQSGLS